MVSWCHGFHWFRGVIGFTGLVVSLHYGIELLVSDFPFKHFCKIAKQAESIRNYQEQVLFMIKHCLGKSQINSIPEWRVFLRNFSLQNKSKSLCLQLRDVILLFWLDWSCPTRKLCLFHKIGKSVYPYLRETPRTVYREQPKNDFGWRNIKPPLSQLKFNMWRPLKATRLEIPKYGRFVPRGTHMNEDFFECVLSQH